MKNKQEKGIVLIAALGLMIFLAVFSATSASIVSTSVAFQTASLRGSQALAIAQAGAEWYSEQLSADINWTDEVSQAAQNFAEGDFTITVNSATATEVNFTSNGQIPSDIGNGTIQRQITQSVQKLSPAFLFALYQGMDPGQNLQLLNNGTNPTQVIGDFWSQGNGVIDGINSVAGGRVFVPNNRNVTGTGTYARELIAAPFPVMPILNTTAYTTAMANYDAILNANASAVNRTVNAGVFNINNPADPECIAGICSFRTFTTTGNVTITGNGTISVTRDILLHGSNGLALGTSLTIAPSAGGTISMITDRGITIGSNNNNPLIAVNNNCFFYSRTNGSNTYLIRVRGSNTTLNSSVLYARRRIVVEEGADILGNSSLFVGYSGSNPNNFLWVTGGAGVTTVEGSLISLSQNNPGMRIDNGGTNKANAVVRGLIYAYGSAATGYCQFADATIQGSAVCTRFSNNRISNVAITYDNTRLFSQPAAVFDSYVVKKRNSWDGL